MATKLIKTDTEDCLSSNSGARENRSNASTIPGSLQAGGCSKLVNYTYYQHRRFLSTRLHTIDYAPNPNDKSLKAHPYHLAEKTLCGYPLQLNETTFVYESVDQSLINQIIPVPNIESVHRSLSNISKV